MVGVFSDVIDSAPFKYNEVKQRHPEKTNVIVFLYAIIGIWNFVGLVAFVTSLVCFYRSGTTEQHAIGLLLAIILGPFYFLYYRCSPSYCGVNTTSAL